MELYCQELKLDHAQVGSETGWIQDQVGFCKIYLQKPIHTVIKEKIFLLMLLRYSAKSAR